MLENETLSPAFYHPGCLKHYLAITTGSKIDLLPLLAQFNHFQAWVQLPEYEQQCVAHLSTSSNKTEFLYYVKKNLELGNKEKATHMLEQCTKFQWPEVFR